MESVFDGLQGVEGVYLEDLTIDPDGAMWAVTEGSMVRFSDDGAMTDLGSARVPHRHHCWY